MLNSVNFYYFSPTGGTRKAGKCLCEEIAREISCVNLGDFGREQSAIPDSEVAVVAVPVFAGRVASVAAEQLRNIDGTGKYAIALAVYGVRAYDDALLELNDILRGCGFQVIASAALVAQHSMVPEVGARRPDAADEAEIREFGRGILAKLPEIRKGTATPPQVPGNYPYRDGMHVTATPISGEGCNRCGTCAAICPTEAIRVKEEGVETDVEKCTLCMACTAACPQKVRILLPAMQEAMNQKLSIFKDVRRKNEFFLF